MRIGKYSITSDSNQFIINEVKVNTKEGSKNFSKDMLTNTNYFTSVSGLLAHIAKLELMASTNEFDSAEEAMASFKASLLTIEQELIEAIKGRG